MAARRFGDDSKWQLIWLFDFGTEQRAAQTAR
jgi:hypothetical protein